MSDPISDPNDLVLVCNSCNNNFVFSAGERAFYEEKRLQTPKKCKPCRAVAKQRRGETTGYNSTGGYNAGGYSDNRPQIMNESRDYRKSNNDDQYNPRPKQRKRRDSDDDDFDF